MSSKTIAVLGATGRTGIEVLKQALSKGYKVKALARTPSKLSVQHINLEVVQGDAKDAEKVHKLLQGADAVVNVLGHTSSTKEDILTQAMQHTLAAMDKNNIKCIIYMAGAGVEQPRDENGPSHVVMKVLLNLFAKKLLNDSEGAAEKMMKSGKDWVLVRVPRLTNGERKGSYNTGYGKMGFAQISRADAAEFILKQVEEKEWIGQAPKIWY